jgi:hypothetical protein
MFKHNQLQNTQRSHKPAKKATKEEDQIAKNILAAKVNEARKLDGEKKLLRFRLVFV